MSNKKHKTPDKPEDLSGLVSALPPRFSFDRLHQTNILFNRQAPHEHNPLRDQASTVLLNHITHNLGDLDLPSANDLMRIKYGREDNNQRFTQTTQSILDMAWKHTHLREAACDFIAPTTHGQDNFDRMVELSMLNLQDVVSDFVDDMVEAEKQKLRAKYPAVYAA